MNILCLTETPPRDFNLPSGIDLVEWRMDLCPLDYDVIKNLNGQWMATLRHVTHGGEFDGSNHRREKLLKRAIELGTKWIDIEAEFPIGELPIEKCLRSVHLKTKERKEIVESFERLKNAPGAIKKWVLPTPFTQDLCDEEKLLIADDTPCVIIHSGAGGQWSRARPPGHNWNYLAMDNEHRSGEGQLTWSENLRLSDGPLFGILGNPVSHSKSPLLHSRMRRAMSLPGAYVKVPVEDTSTFFKSEVFKLFDGFSVTAPHKQAVLEILSESSEAVTFLKACNTLTKSNKGWQGENTDYLAVKKLIEQHHTSKKANVAVLGCGGFGRAAAGAAQASGHTVTVVNRSLDKAQALAQELSCNYGPLDNFNPKEYNIIIQATSAEMHGHACPIDSSQCQDNTLLIESIYSSETQFLNKAPDSCTKLGGQEIFQLQGEEQLALWTGKTISHTLGGMALEL